MTIDFQIYYKISSEPIEGPRIEIRIQKGIDPIVKHITIIAGRIFLFGTNTKLQYKNVHVTFLLSTWLFESSTMS